MAYISQTKKAEIAPVVKGILAEYGLKGSLSVDNHSSLVLTLKSGKIDFGDATQVNTYWITDHFTGKAQHALLALKNAMMVGNHDNSDAMTDYFDVGWYVNIHVGRWDKPYVVSP